MVFCLDVAAAFARAEGGCTRVAVCRFGFILCTACTQAAVAIANGMARNSDRKKVFDFRFGPPSNFTSKKAQKAKQDDVVHHQQFNL